MIRWDAKHAVIKGWGGEPDRPRPTYEGAVLSVGHFKTVQIMSDVWASEGYARVWDGEKITDVATSLDDMGLGIYGIADVDATPETKAAAREWLIGQIAEADARAFDASTERIAAEARKVTRGKTVVVSRGRKVAKGTTGDVFWIGDGRYGVRVGIKDAAGTVHWTAASNVDVVSPDDYIDEIPIKPSAAEFRARAEARIARIEAGTAHRFEYDERAAWLAPSRREAA